MTFKKIGLLGLILGVGLGTAACTDGYGYSGVSLGYGGGGGYYGDPYYDGYGAGYGGYSGYGSPYYGWYNDFYYPGTGIYVYDQYRRPYRWNNAQRSYWQQRRNQWRGDRNYQNNWGNFDRNDRRYDGQRQYDGRRQYDGQRQYNGQRNYDGNRAPRGDYRGQRRDGGTASTANPDRNRGYRGRAAITTNAQPSVRTESAPPPRVRAYGEGRRGDARAGVRAYGARERPE